MQSVYHMCLAIVMSGLCLGAAQAADAAAINAHHKAYGTAGQAVMDMVNAGSVDPAQVEPLVLTMVKASVAMSQAYKAKLPESKGLIDPIVGSAAVLDASGVVTAIGPMRTETFDHIAAYWHDLGFCEDHDPGIDIDDEDNERLQDPIHLIVHPVMVLVAAEDFAKDGNARHLELIKEEMDEGLEHNDEVRDTILGE